MNTNSPIDIVPETTLTDDTVGKAIKETAAKTAEWFLAIVGITYACGFLIVFSFFKSFGINTVEFLEAKYIHIGSLFVMACITIVLPVRWMFKGILIWFDNKENKEEVRDILRILVEGGSRLEVFKKRVLKRFFVDDWKLVKKQGLHASVPATGSAIFMMWCFLLLLTFARPDFTQEHTRLIFFNLIFPMAIISLAIPADWLNDWLINNPQDYYLHPKAKTTMRRCNGFLRIYWMAVGVVCLFLFFRFRETFDKCLRYSISAYFVLPIVVIAITWVLLIYGKHNRDNINRKRQRLTAILWVLYPIQWILFLAQFWVFVRVIITDNLKVSLREVFVGGDWYLISFPWRILKAIKTFYQNGTQEPNVFPKGGFIFVCFVLLALFFGFRYLYLTRREQEAALLDINTKNKKAKPSKTLNIISTICVLGVLLYFSISSFARYIYPYIPAVKGGGDFTLSNPVKLTFDTNCLSSIPLLVQSNNMIMLDENSSCVYLASTNDVGGPEKWRSSNKKPTVYEIHRQAIISIAYLNPTNEDTPINIPPLSSKVKGSKPHP